MNTMLVVRIEAVVIKVDGDDVREGQLLDRRLRVQRAMKDERNQRQRFSETQREARLDKFPVLFVSPGFLFLTLPNLHDTRVIPTGTRTTRRAVVSSLASIGWRRGPG